MAIPILRGDRVVEAQLKAAEEVSAPAVVIGELLVGALRSANAAKNQAEVEAFARRVTVLQIDIETSRRYAVIKDDLRRKGQPIPENDIWIAAVAIQYDVVLATRDSHFEEVAGLQTDRW